MIEEGNWKAKACEAALGYSGTVGPNGERNPQVAVDFVLLEGPNAGSHITWYGFFTEKTFDSTVESLRFCGWEGTSFSDLRGIDRNEVQLVIQHEPDLEGEYRARVRWVNQLGGIIMKDRMDAGAAKMFDAQMRGRLMALEASKRGTSSPTNTSAAPRQSPAQRVAPPQQQRPTHGDQPSSEQGVADDNIPF